MKKLLLSATAIALAATASVALAADLPSRKEAPVYTPPPPPPPMWTGFYVGANIGGGWKSNNGNTNTFVPYTDTVLGGVFLLPGGGSTSNNSGGVVGGGQIGYNYQFGSSIVIGVETDFQGTSIGSGGNGNTVAILPGLVPGSALVPLATGNNVGSSIPWFGTVRGRAGFLVTPTLLVYGTGGFAYGGVHASAAHALGAVANNTALPTFGGVGNFSDTATGWTAGGGLEWMIAPNWSVKAEALYYDLGSVEFASSPVGALSGNTVSFANSPSTRVRYDGVIARAGINYHLNWGSAAPIMAKF